MSEKAISGTLWNVKAMQITFAIATPAYLVPSGYTVSRYPCWPLLPCEAGLRVEWHMGLRIKYAPWRYTTGSRTAGAREIVIWLYVVHHLPLAVFVLPQGMAGRFLILLQCLQLSLLSIVYVLMGATRGPPDYLHNTGLSWLCYISAIMIAILIWIAVSIQIVNRIN